MLLVVAGGWHTDVRRPLPHPLQPIEGLRWWYTPLERNAFMRMPVVTGDLFAVDAANDGQVIWAVGEKALIVGTTDGGRTWRRGRVVPATTDAGSAPAAAEPKPAAAAFNIIDAFTPIAAARAGDLPKEEQKGSNAAYDPKQQISRDVDTSGSSNQTSGATTAVAQPPQATVKIIPSNRPAAPASKSGPPPKVDQSPAQQQTPDDADLAAHDVWGTQTELEVLMNSSLNSIAIVDATSAVAVGENGIVLLTQDGGATWMHRVSNVTANLTSVAFTDAGSGIALGEQGTVLRTTDGGKAWEAGATETLEEAAADGTSGFAKRWLELLGDDYRVKDAELGFFDGELAFLAAGPGGALLTSSDGEHSMPLTAHRGIFRGLAMSDGMHGVIIGAHGSILATSDGGETWIPRASGVDTDLLSVRVGADSFVAASISGDAGAQVFIESRDAGRTWQIADGNAGVLAPQLAPFSVPPGVSEKAFRDARQGLVIADGKISRTDNAGGSWQAVTLGTIAPAVGIAFATPDRAVALAQGRVLLSKDAGRTFEPVRYHRYPSPWLWMACALLLAASALLLRRSLRKPEVEEQPSSITDAAASDRPIEWGDPDSAGLRDIALGLSRFLRNRRTEPPLTIAVTGEWGTGKSSLMNLLRHDLARYGYRPVWFNAWHHQSGENLLGSLLANIHAQGVPPLHTVAGLDFRLTLLAIRSRRFWWRLTLTLFLIAVVIFSYEALGESASKLWVALTADSDKGIEGGISNLGAATGLLGIVAAVLTPIVGAMRAASAFGLQPAKLIAAVATTKHDESARIQAGARYRFAREFADFTRALDPRPLVIFIDDLDRCRAENVIEVLEAVNFLISSGRCIVVIGMARRWVETCVGLAFKELAQAHIEKRDDDEFGTATNPAEEQQMFARHYLEKLINVEIRVPRLSDSAASAILQGTAPAASPSSLRYGVGTALLRTGAALVLVAIVGGVVALGKSTAEWLGVLNSTALSQPQNTGQSTAATSAELAPAAPGRESSGRADDGAAIVFDAPRAQAPMGWYLGTGASVALALAAFVAVAMFARKESRTDDSPAFREALSILQPWIMVGGTSPRSLKRFINHVRYIAMRFRPGADIPTTYENLTNRIRVRFGRAPIDSGNSNVSPRLQLSEELLVALATLHRCNEGWLDELFIARERDLDTLIFRDIGSNIEELEERRAVMNRLRESIGKFNERFSDSQLFENEMLDRRHAIAFYEVMAFETGARDQMPPEEAAEPTPLRQA
jgi:photosystem II stability/assembly factor-like uncharacterized protein